MSETQNEVSKYIQTQLKAGKPATEVISALVANGWQQEAATDAVNQQAGVPTPPPASAAPAPPNTSAQTGNAGTPVQSESVQYNMMMAPVESRVGFFLKLASVGLWILAVFVGSALASIIEKVQNTDSEIAPVIVFTAAISIVAIPIFFIANKKMQDELAKNPAQVDDLFFKKATRSGLYGGVVLTGISVFAAAYNILGAAFLENSGSITGFLQSMAFVLTFGAVMGYFWQLHAKTKR